MAYKNTIFRTKKIMISATVGLLLAMSFGAVAYAGTTCGSSANGNIPTVTSIDFGCQGRGNGITDLTFGHYSLSYEWCWGGNCWLDDRCWNSVHDISR